jgi:hypothetical protein
MSLANEEFVHIELLDDLTLDDEKKAQYLLNMYPRMMEIVLNYEFVKNQQKDEMTLYDAMSASRGYSNHADSNDLHNDVVGNTVSLKEKRKAIYNVYATLTIAIRGAVSCIRNSHELAIADLLYFRGMAYSNAVNCMSRGYSKEVWGIGATTFSEKRKRLLGSITNFLKINGTLDFMILKKGVGKKKDEYDFIIRYGKSK